MARRKTKKAAETERRDRIKAVALSLSGEIAELFDELTYDFELRRERESEAVAVKLRSEVADLRKKVETTYVATRGADQKAWVRMDDLADTFVAFSTRLRRLEEQVVDLERRRHPLRLLRAEEVAERLGLSLSTLARWRRKGGGPKWRRLADHRSIRYLETEIVMWLLEADGTLDSDEDS